MKRVTNTLSLHGFLRIKADYGISVAATVRRAKDLGIIAPERYRSLSIQLSSQGWRTNEPVEVAIEEPRLLGQSLTKIYGENGWRASAAQYGLDPTLLKRWLPTWPDTVSGSSAKILTPRRWGTERPL